MIERTLTCVCVGGGGYWEAQNFKLRCTLQVLKSTHVVIFSVATNRGSIEKLRISVYSQTQRCIEKYTRLHVPNMVILNFTCRPHVTRRTDTAKLKNDCHTLTSLSAGVGTPSILSNPSKIFFHSFFLRDVVVSGTGISIFTSVPFWTQQYVRLRTQP